MRLSRARFSAPQADGESVSQHARQVFRFLNQNPHAARRRASIYGNTPLVFAAGV